MRIILGLIFIGLALLLPIYFNEILVFFIKNFSTGWVFGTIYIRVLVILLVAIALHLIFSAFKRTKNLRFVFTFLIALIPGFGISFIHPIYEGDYGYVQNSELPPLNIEALEANTENAFKFNNEVQVMCFFTSSCPHCMVLSNKLGINHIAGQKIKVSAFFPSTPEARERFIAQTGGKGIEHYSIDDELFKECTGGSYPKTYLIDAEGNTINFWSGDQVNFSALDHLLSLE